MEQAALSFVQWAGGDTLKGAWKWIIRPPREEYELSDLGPEVFDVAGRPCTRKDIQLTSTQGHTLECSHFRPAADAGEQGPCVVYLHGNGSSRLEALWVVPRLLQRNVSVFAFDFAGCGHSTGDYVSLGHHEERDLCVVLRHLRRSGVPSVALWGRSMGAATAVLRAAKDRSLAACVLDSSFADLRTVCVEFAGQAALPVPRLLVGAALEAVRQEVDARAGFDMCAVAPALAAPRARCPALFACARDDTLVPPHHAEDLRSAWGGQSMAVVFAGGHNDRRPDEFLDQAAAFLAERLGADGRAPLRPATERPPPAGSHGGARRRRSAPPEERATEEPRGDQAARRSSQRMRKAAWRKLVGTQEAPCCHRRRRPNRRHTAT